MRTTRMALMILAVVGLVAVMTVNSHAGANNYTCTVASAGPSAGSTYQVVIRLTYSSGTPVPTTKTKSFIAPATHEKEFLAVALTAMANTKKVSALVDFDGTSTAVTRLYLLP